MHEGPEHRVASGRIGRQLDHDLRRDRMLGIGLDDLADLDAQAVRDTHLGVAIRALLGEKYVVPLYVGLGPLPLPMKLRWLFVNGQLLGIIPPWTLWLLHY